MTTAIALSRASANSPIEAHDADALRTVFRVALRSASIPLRARIGKEHVSSEVHPPHVRRFRRGVVLRLMPIFVAMALACAGRNAPASTTQDGQSAFPAFVGGVPVLLYHGIDGRSVAPGSFEAQMARLHGLGFRTITIDDLVRTTRGDPVALPPRPILITFDDAFASSWRHADDILRRYGWTATMYVPTGLVGLPGRLRWSDLDAMAASGRWQIEEHAGNGHRMIEVDGAGRRRPFFGHAMVRETRLETISGFRERITTDVELGAEVLAKNIRGWASHGTFAVPFGDHGQVDPNAWWVGPTVDSALARRFVIVFAGSADDFATTTGFTTRIRVAPDWDADALERHLRDGLARLGHDAPRAERASGSTSTWEG